MGSSPTFFRVSRHALVDQFDAFGVIAVGGFHLKARSKSSRMGSMSRTDSMAANCRYSERSRSQRRRALSNSARARSRRSCRSAFSAANCSRSAASAESWPSRIESKGPSSGRHFWGFSLGGFVYPLLFRLAFFFAISSS